MRKIVLLRKHEPLEAAARMRSFATAGSHLDKRIRVRGVEFDQGFAPVRVPARIGVRADRPAAVGFRYDDRAPITSFAVRAEFKDEDAVARLLKDRGDEVAGVYADPTIRPFLSTYCGDPAVGKTADVAKKVGVAAMRKAGLTGKGVLVAVVDTGIDGSQIKVEGGWGPSPGYSPGSAPPDHGTMVAYDARIAAPDALIYDYALLRSTGNTWEAFLSDAIAAFDDLIQLRERADAPLVVNNSWGIFDRSEDEPIGSPGNYSANPEHPFNQIVGTAVAAGLDVFFAAGNCGEQCADGRCGAGDTGPGASIHGANSHPDAITVAATTVTDKRLGYSSQGPGGLHARKPDLAAPSHFTGSGVYDADGGTSAASPVAAGVAAALRQRAKRRSPASLKGVLQRTARDIDGNGWDADIGYGVIDGAAAAKYMGFKPKK